MLRCQLVNVCTLCNSIFVCDLKCEDSVFFAIRHKIQGSMKNGVDVYFFSYDIESLQDVLIARSDRKSVV